MIDLDALERRIARAETHAPSARNGRTAIWLESGLARALVQRLREAEAHDEMTNNILIRREAEWVNSEAHFKRRIAQLEQDLAGCDGERQMAEDRVVRLERVRVALEKATVRRDPRHRMSMLVNDWAAIVDVLAAVEEK